MDPLLTARTPRLPARRLKLWIQHVIGSVIALVVHSVFVVVLSIEVAGLVVLRVMVVLVVSLALILVHPVRLVVDA